MRPPEHISLEFTVPPTGEPFSDVFTFNVERRISDLRIQQEQLMELITELKIKLHYVLEPDVEEDNHVYKDVSDRSAVEQDLERVYKYSELNNIEIIGIIRRVQL